MFILPFLINRLGTHVEQQKLGRFVTNTLNLNLSWPAGTPDKGTIALAECDIANLDLHATLLGLRLPTHDKMKIDVSLALLDKLMHNALARTQDTSTHTQIRMQRNRLALLILPTMPLHTLHDPTKPILFPLIPKNSSRITRSQPTHIRLCPYLQKMHILILIATVFRMLDSRARRRELHFASS